LAKEAQEKKARINFEWAKKVHREQGGGRQLNEDYEATLKTVQTFTMENESLRFSQRTDMRL